MEWLRPRVVQLALSMGLLLALAPTPASRVLAERLRAGVYALQSGQPEQALGEFELALALEHDLPAAHWLSNLVQLPISWLSLVGSRAESDHASLCLRAGLA